MSQLRSKFFTLMLISSAFVATACGPQTQPEAGEPAPTTEGEKTAAGKCDRAGRTYVSHDQGECLTLNWVCPAGQQQFLDECGCGCQ